MLLKFELFFIIALLSFFSIQTIYAVESPGYKKTLVIETDGYEFNVITVSNFTINDFEFNKDEKRLTLFLETGTLDNLSEIQIPKNLINGNFTFFLDGKQIFPTIQSNERITFITIEFSGNKTSQLDIIGTTYLPEFSQITMLILATSIIGTFFVKRKKLFIN